MALTVVYLSYALDFPFQLKCYVLFTSIFKQLLEILFQNDFSIKLLPVYLISPSMIMKNIQFITLQVDVHLLPE